MPDLPIEPVLPALRGALRGGTRAVLQAPPGAGKTTRVPLALVDEPWLAGRRILLLEPRRLAARAAAHRMASLLGEATGRTVGYRIRLDTRVSAATRIEVVTEGVLTRMLQSDPALEGIGLVVFDEFHERSLHSDLGLALCIQAQALLREDLRLLVMSATLDGDRVAELLGGAPVVTSEGRSFPVETRWLDHRPDARHVEPAVARAVREALRSEPGDLLVFLPGAAEIHRTARLLAEGGLDPDVRLAPLYGNLPQEEQDRAIAPSPPGRRKVVLATSIAETSLTIEGVRVVVDSGLMRVPRFSPRSGMTRLETRPVSRAAADQRRGRAGRLAPGVCLRLWTRADDDRLTPFTPAEILEADLAPLALELAAWGTPDPAHLSWLDPPPAGAYAQARELLAQLGALDASGAITPHGRALAAFGLHPRLAHMLLRAREEGLGRVACDLAALLGERDLFRAGDGGPGPDVRLRVEALRVLDRGDRPDAASALGFPVDRETARRVLREARLWRERLGLRPGGADDVDGSGPALALAYPDRIGQQRPGRPGRFLLRNGRAAALPDPGLPGEPEFLVAADLDGRQRESRIFLAAPVSAEDLRRLFAEQIAVETSVSWDAPARAVQARRRERLGALTLREAPLADPPPGAVTAALLEGLRREGAELLPWTKAARQLQERILFLHAHDPGWPDVRTETLLATLEEWLAPLLGGMRRADDLQRLDLAGALLGRLTWPQRAALDELAPTHLTVPSGSRVPIDYGDPAAPVLAVRLQEMFGLQETPRIARGQVPLTLHLLSPAHRPVQVTRDLASFWRTAYFDVKKDLRGRYPKHYWPDDPFQALPTSRTRPRG